MTNPKKKRFKRPLGLTGMYYRKDDDTYMIDTSEKDDRPRGGCKNQFIIFMILIISLSIITLIWLL